jgi:hypothetical protein
MYRYKTKLNDILCPNSLLRGKQEKVKAVSEQFYHRATTTGVEMARYERGHTHTYIHSHTHIHTCMHTCMHACMHTHTTSAAHGCHNRTSRSGRYHEPNTSWTCIFCSADTHDAICRTVTEHRRKEQLRCCLTLLLHIVLDFTKQMKPNTDVYTPQTAVFVTAVLFVKKTGVIYRGTLWLILLNKWNQIQMCTHLRPPCLLLLFCLWRKRVLFIGHTVVDSDSLFFVILLSLLKQISMILKTGKTAYSFRFIVTLHFILRNL